MAYKRFPYGQELLNDASSDEYSEANDDTGGAVKLSHQRHRHHLGSLAKRSGLDLEILSYLQPRAKQSKHAKIGTAEEYYKFKALVKPEAAQKIAKKLKEEKFIREATYKKLSEDQRFQPQIRDLKLTQKRLFTDAAALADLQGELEILKFHDEVRADEDEAARAITSAQMHKLLEERALLDRKIERLEIAEQELIDRKRKAAEASKKSYEKKKTTKELAAEEAAFSEFADFAEKAKAKSKGKSK